MLGIARVHASIGRPDVGLSSSYLKDSSSLDYIDPHHAHTQKAIVIQQRRQNIPDTPKTNIPTIPLLHFLPSDDASRRLVLSTGALCANLEWKNLPCTRKLASIMSAVKRKWTLVAGIETITIRPFYDPKLTHQSVTSDAPLDLTNDNATLTLRDLHQQMGFPMPMVCLYTITVTPTPTPTPTPTAVPLPTPVPAPVAAAPQPMSLPSMQSIQAALQSNAMQQLPALFGNGLMPMHMLMPFLPSSLTAAAHSSSKSAHPPALPNLLASVSAAASASAHPLLASAHKSKTASSAAVLAHSGSKLNHAAPKAGSMLPPTTFSAYANEDNDHSGVKKRKLNPPETVASTANLVIPAAVGDVPGNSNGVDFVDDLPALPVASDTSRDIPPLTNGVAEEVALPNLPIDPFMLNSNLPLLEPLFQPESIVRSAEDTSTLAATTSTYTRTYSTPHAATNATPRRTNSVKKNLFAQFTASSAAMPSPVPTPDRMARIGTPASSSSHHKHLFPSANVQPPPGVSLTSAIPPIAAAPAAINASSSTRAPLGTLFSSSPESILNISNNIPNQSILRPTQRTNVNQNTLLPTQRPAVIPAFHVNNTPAAAASVAPSSPARPSRPSSGKENVAPKPTSPSKSLTSLAWLGDQTSMALFHALHPNLPIPTLRASNAAAPAPSAAAATSNTSSPTIQPRPNVGTLLSTPHHTTPIMKKGRASSKQTSGSSKVSGATSGSKRKRGSPSSSSVDGSSDEVSTATKKSRKRSSPPSGSSSSSSIGSSSKNGSRKRKVDSIDSKHARKRSKKQRRSETIKEETNGIDDDEDGAPDWIDSWAEELDLDDTDSDRIDSPETHQHSSPAPPHTDEEEVEEEHSTQVPTTHPTSTDAALFASLQMPPFMPIGSSGIVDIEEHHAHHVQPPPSSYPFEPSFLSDDPSRLDAPLPLYGSDAYDETQDWLNSDLRLAAAGGTTVNPTVTIDPVLDISSNEFDLDPKLDALLEECKGDVKRFMQAPIATTTEQETHATSA